MFKQQAVFYGQRTENLKKIILNYDNKIMGSSSLYETHPEWRSIVPTFMFVCQVVSEELTHTHIALRFLVYCNYLVHNAIA